MESHSVNEQSLIITTNVSQLNEVITLSSTKGKIVSTFFIDTLTGKLASSISYEANLKRNKWKMISVKFDEGSVSIEKDGLAAQAIVVVDATIDAMKKQIKQKT